MGCLPGESIEAWSKRRSPVKFWVLVERDIARVERRWVRPSMYILGSHLLDVSKIVYRDGRRVGVWGLYHLRRVQ